MSIFRGSIHKGAMQVIKSKIAEAQTAHDAECEEIERQAEENKKASEAKHIQSIIGKLI